MYVRLGFAVAIVDPDILLVDEVLAGRRAVPAQVFEKFAEFKESARIVIVSHALGTMPTCDEVALLNTAASSVGPAGQVVDAYLGDVHTDRIADGEHGVRWGSGEAAITRIEQLSGR